MYSTSFDPKTLRPGESVQFRSNFPGHTMFHRWIVATSKSEVQAELYIDSVLIAKVVCSPSGSIVQELEKFGGSLRIVVHNVGDQETDITVAATYCDKYVPVFPNGIDRAIARLK